MNSSSPDRTLPILIINAALICGVIFFALVVLTLFKRQEAVDPAIQKSTLTMIAMGAAVSAIACSFVIAGKFRRKTVNDLAAGELKRPENSTATTDEEALYGHFTTQMIMRTALLEGAAFFALTSYIIEQNSAVLSTVAILLTVMGVTFATPSRVHQWVARVQRDADDLRQLNGGAKD